MDEVEFLGASGSLLSYNLYSYCEGNPGNNVDPSGNAPFLGWGLQIEIPILGGVSFGIELIWYKSIYRGYYPSNSYPFVYLYGGYGIDSIAKNKIQIMSILYFVKEQTLKTFSSTSKLNWKRAIKNLKISICAFMLYGTISSPYNYTGPFATITATIFNIKTFISSSLKGDVRAYGIGISSSKFGFAPISESLYFMVPPIFVKSFIDGFSTLFSTVKTISALA